MIVRCVGCCHLFVGRYGDYKGEGIVGGGEDMADLCRRVGRFERKADRRLHTVRMDGKSFAQVDKCREGSRWMALNRRAGCSV